MQLLLDVSLVQENGRERMHVMKDRDDERMNEIRQQKHNPET